MSSETRVKIIQLLLAAPLNVTEIAERMKMPVSSAISAVLKLEEACREMERDPLLRGLLGDRVFEQYYDSKLAAWKEYDSQVTCWEIESYLYKI